MFLTLAKAPFLESQVLKMALYGGMSHTHIYNLIYIYIYTCIHIHMYTYTPVYMYIHVYMHTCMHACIHTYTITYAYNHIHAHTYDDILLTMSLFAGTRLATIRGHAPTEHLIDSPGSRLTKRVDHFQGKPSISIAILYIIYT